MPEDYKKVVLDYYEEKINDGSLSPRLLDSTPGSIREYCIFIYRQRSSSEDDEIVRSFFGDTKQECLNLLENSFAAKFRQLPKILKRKVENPGDKYIELIAWLIDFKPRPSTAYYKSFYTQTKVEPNEEEVDEENQKLSKTQSSNSISKTKDDNVLGDIIENNEDLDENRVAPEVAPNNFIDKLGLTTMVTKPSFIDRLKGNLKIGKTLFSLIIAATIFGGSYLFLNGNKQCMYWTGDHYEPIGCKVKIDEARVIALDQQKVDRLKRITRLDTIGEKDLGKIWYAKIKLDSVTFYTDSGEYPLDTRKRLLKMTPYILNKYIIKK